MLNLPDSFFLEGDLEITTTHTTEANPSQQNSRGILERGIRVVSVQTNSGTYRRPIVKVALLLSDSEN